MLSRPHAPSWPTSGTSERPPELALRALPNSAARSASPQWGVGAAARAKLDALNGDTAAATLEIENVESAIAEAEHRVATAEAAVEQADQRAKARLIV